MAYTVETTGTFDREFKKRHKDKKNRLQSIVARLEQHPEYGKPLRGRLHGIWQIRMGPFRIWYEINDVDKKVVLKAVLHKDEAEDKY